MKPQFFPGTNIAMKVPSHEYQATVEFYRAVLGFETVDVSSPDNFDSIAFKFGDKNLWIDRIDGISQAEIWLEIITDDVESAARYFKGHGCVRRDEIEPLPDGFKAFWLANPANIIHLINQKES